jgi:glycosyltransferase involved in cell wall biosynthesis
MRILFISGSSPPMPCGVGDYTYSLAEALVRQGVDVGLLTSSEAAAGNGVVEVFPVMQGWSLRHLPIVIRSIRDFSPDIVHVQFPSQGYGRGWAPVLLPLVAWLLGKRVFQTWHEIYRFRGPFSFIKQSFLFFLRTMVPSDVVVVRPGYREALRWPFSWLIRHKTIGFVPNASAIPKAALKPEGAQILKDRYLQGARRLIVFFGFLIPSKGIELLFEIADSAHDHLVIAGAFGDQDYQAHLETIADSEMWRGKVSFVGFLDQQDAAELLGVADAVVLPFRDGGGLWNTSIHGAVLQGSFVVTTSVCDRGYDKERNIYWSKIDDVKDMKAAMTRYMGNRLPHNSLPDSVGWKDIALEHIYRYGRAVGHSRKHS